MDRKKFLAVMGSGAAAAVCSYCLGGCKNPDAITGPTNVNFTLDLTQSANSALTHDGGYLYNNGVIVARISASVYVAVSQACTHQGNTVVYDASGNQFYCPAHGSTFRTDGSVSNGPASSPLTKYHAQLNGTLLKVTS